jgi:lysozyme family protein
MPTRSFAAMCDAVFHWESGLKEGEPGAIGIYSDSPGDRGGPTRWGVTLATYTQFLGRTATAAEVRAMPETDAVAIYAKSFFADPHLDLLPAGSLLQFEVFDIAVGSGPRRAIILLQQTLSENGYPCAVDGLLGRETAAQADAAWRVLRGGLVVRLIEARVAYYDLIIRRDPSQEIFREGWHSRANMLRAEAMATLDQAAAAPGEAPQAAA